MISGELLTLIAAAAALGFVHTLFGPDHYLPFIVMSRAGKWSTRKTACITVMCGIGHVLSSVLLGFIGIALGIAVTKLVAVESFRGGMAAWGLIAFGLIYFIWGVRSAIRNRPHKHLHAHEEGLEHAHKHSHSDEHLHAHEEKNAKSLTPWVLFTIFIFGPCEPLIPLLMYPAAKSSLFGVALVTLVFGAVTITTMLSIVLISILNVTRLRITLLERYGHALAGATVFCCGMAIQFLGL